MTEEELDFPDRRRHGYVDLEQRVDRHIAEIDARFRKRYRGMLVAFSLIGITSTVAIFGFGIVLREQGKQDDRIQQQRRDSIGRSCEDQNARHDNTIQALLAASQADIEQAKKKSVTSQGPVTPKEIRNRVKVTIGLIDALQPKQDCEQLIEESVKEPPG